MPNYRRDRFPGGTYFFTVVIADRTTSLLTDRIAGLFAAIRIVRAARPFRMPAMVVLPDHVHCIWTLPPGDADYATRWSAIKSGFSRRIETAETRSLSRERKRERGIWQRRYWEHRIRDDDDLRSHVDYIHFNPVRHGYVGHAADWPHSTLHRWVERGWLTADWGSHANPIGAALGQRCGFASAGQE